MLYISQGNSYWYDGVMKVNDPLSMKIRCLKLEMSIIYGTWNLIIVFEWTNYVTYVWEA